MREVPGQLALLTKLVRPAQGHVEIGGGRSWALDAAGQRDVDMTLLLTQRTVSARQYGFGREVCESLCGEQEPLLYHICLGIVARGASVSAAGKNPVL